MDINNNMAAGERRTILIIDDEPAIAQGASFRLRSLGYATLTAGDGRSGFALAKEHSPGVILLDLHLPAMHGRDVLRQLRDTPETARIPVVVLSGCDADGQEALGAGAYGFLSKPYEWEALRDVVERAFSQKTLDIPG